MVHFTQCDFRTLFYSDLRMHESLHAGYPIRVPRGHRMCAPRPSFSQLATPFLAKKLQGIHREPIFRLAILPFASFFLLPSLVISNIFSSMENTGLEPVTYSLQSYRSSQVS